MVEVSAGHEYVRGTRGSGIVYIAADVLGMSVVRGMCPIESTAHSTFKDPKT